MTNNLAIIASAGADKVMHAALHLVGKFDVPVDEFSYEEPTVWQSEDPAVVMLLERYRFFVKLLEYGYKVHNL